MSYILYPIVFHQHGACRMKFPQLLEAVSHVMGFIYSEVFLANDEVSTYNSFFGLLDTV